MKLRHLLFGLLAGVAFVACTNDDDPAGVTPAKGADEVAAAKYITVDLQFPGSGAATRAIDDAGFSPAATAAENTVTEAAFLFFKADGSKAADPFVIKAGEPDANGDVWNPEPNPDAQIPAAKKNPVIVMKNPTAIPTSMVVLINSGKKENELNGMTVANLQGDDFAADFAALANNAEKPSFVMSNSVYVAGGNLVVGAPIGAENVKESAELAKAEPAPVKVYVERAVAKVTVKNEATPTSGVEGVNVALKGWGFAYENNKSYLIKNLAKSYDFGATWAGWNDATKFRSYWADAPYTEPVEGGVDDNTTWTAANKELDGTTAYYTNEHVDALPQTTIEKGGKPTAIIVAAQLQDENGAPLPLFKHKGILYKENGFKQFMANGATVKQYYKPKPQGKEGEFVNLDAADFGLNIVAANSTPERYDADVNLTLIYAGDIYDSNGIIVKDRDEAKAKIEGVKETVQCWNNGATYYYVPIVQNSALNVNVKDPKAETPAYWGLFGVVRNHFYQLTIKKVQGLGTPVPDPGQIIIPTPPVDQKSYIGAEVNIVDWKNVTQEVNLGE